MTTDLRRPTATDPWIIRASDGAAIYNLPDKAQLPAALDAGALKVKEQVPLTEISLSAATLAALETVNAVISDGGATISIDDGAASITVDGSVALDAGTLAALETINAVVSGTVALDSTALAALETIELGGTSLAALESITVVGALTDAELRASPVPVSGTVSTGGLTDTQLRATPVSVEQATSVDVADGGGSLTVDGPATDAQLRATPLPVSGTVTASGPLTDAQLAARLPLSVEQATSVDIADGGGSITVDAPVGTPVRVDPTGTTTQPVSGTVTASGPLTDTQLRASAVSVEQATSVTVDAGTGPFPVSDNAGSLTVDSPGLPVALDGVSLKVKEQSPLTQPLTDAQLAARLPLSVEQATSVAATNDQAAVTTGSITSGSGASSRVDAACTGYPACSIVLGGTYNIPLVNIEGSDDGGTTFPHDLQYWVGGDAQAIGAFSPVANTHYLLRVDTFGMTHVRFLATAYTSGTGAVRITPVASPMPIPANALVAVSELPALPALSAGSAVIGNVGHNVTGISDGRKVVTTAGTRVTLAGSTAAKYAVITAETDNTGLIVVGGTGVVASLSTRQGTPLNPGDSVSLPCDNLTDINLDSTVSGDGVTFAYVT